ncbi:hypothetical protein D6777_02310 [Candidatus Woesearchaeota archaeon]|nr:MAG: hypothetical protein D6777_02310 [Candidatus Woesearchaeota archaeon]
MIAFECFRSYRLRDIATILFAVIMWIFASYVVNFLVESLMLKIIIIMLVGNFLLTILAMLVNKAGTAMLYYSITSLLTMNMQPFEGMHWAKVYTFVAAAIMFELIFISVKIEISSIPLDIIIGVVLSNFLMPFVANYLSYTSLSVLNLALTFALTGLTASILALAFWKIIRNRKFVLRFEYEF